MAGYLPGAEPFFFAGNQTGCLLLHGFTGTPYEMRELGERLAAQGYSVSGPALAGHATSVEDMYPTTWHDWYRSVTDAYDELARTCDAIVPIGLSMGASLALFLAAHRSVAAVVAVSTPTDIHSPLIPLFRVFPFLSHFVPFIKDHPEKDDTLDPTIRPKHPSYKGVPTRCAASLILDLLPRVQKDLLKIHAPTLLIQSHGDRVIPPDSLEQIYSRLGSADKKKLWLEKSGHLVLEDYSKEQAFEQILTFVREHVRESMTIPTGVAAPEARHP